MSVERGISELIAVVNLISSFIETKRKEIAVQLLLPDASSDLTGVSEILDELHAILRAGHTRLLTESIPAAAAQQLAMSGVHCSFVDAHDNRFNYMDSPYIVVDSNERELSMIRWISVDILAGQVELFEELPKGKYRLCFDSLVEYNDTLKKNRV